MLQGMFSCQICYCSLDLKQKMPESSLGCGCGKDICVPCFMKDFESRRVPIWLNEHGMSKWDDDLQLQNHLVDSFQVENELETFEEAFDHPKFEEYLLANFHLGKKCPFCGQMCVWQLDQTPRVLPSTGRLTFYAPCYIQPLPMPLNSE